MITIGLVDDHQMFLDGMVSVLTNQNDYSILFVENNAKSALERIKIDEPDIVISDISMPDMNGIEFIKLLKKNHNSIKILVLSMFENLQTFENMDGYLQKETDKEELIKAINTIVLENGKYFKTPKRLIDEFEFRHSILSPREKEIIQLIANEYTTDEIANQLFISKGTIEAHRKNIFLKLQVKNVAGLIKKAIYLGVVK